MRVRSTCIMMALACAIGAVPLRSAAETYPLNPKADYFRYCGGCGVKQRIDLADAGINEGDIIHIVTAGACEWSCLGGCCVEAVMAAFTDTDTACPSSNQRLQAKFPDGTNVPAYPDPHGWFDDKDFNVRDASCGYGNDIFVEVPDGAEYLFLAVPDGYICDNVNTAACDGIDVTVTVAGPIYVDENASGSDNGTSWDDAYVDLQDALAEACARVCVEDVVINVAEGTYKPDASDPYERFELCKNVRLYGSWWNNLSMEWVRDTVNHPTILSGDLLGNDDDNPSAQLCVGDWESTPSPGVCWNNPNKDVPIGNIGDNTRTLVTIAGNSEDTVVLDGVIVQGGFGGYANQYGGGLHCLGASPTINDCTFRYNYAGVPGQRSGGAAMWLEAANAEDIVPTISYCTFEGNVSSVASNPTNTEFAAGAVVLSGDGAGGAFMGSIANCEFSGNFGYHGGAMAFNEPVGASVADCTFEENISAARGGAIMWGGDSNHSLSITGCEFNNNSVRYNLACVDDLSSGARIRGGGAIMVSSGVLTSTAPVLTLGNCTFQGNEQLDDDYDCDSTGGGAVALENTAATIYNCLFYDNAAHGNGGGLFIYGNEDNANFPHASNVQLVNSTFADNHSDAYGGGVFVNGRGDYPARSSDAKVVGCILYYNTADNSSFLDREQIHFDGFESTPGNTDPIYSCIECDRDPLSSCVGDHTANMFYDIPGFENHSLDDYTLADTSDLLDMGCRINVCTNGYDEEAMGTLDLNGDPRRNDSEIGCDEVAEIEMGCFEHEACTP